MLDLHEYSGLEVALRTDETPIGRVTGWSELVGSLFVNQASHTREIHADAVILCPVGAMITPDLVREFTARKVADVAGRKMAGRSTRLHAVVDELRNRGVLD